MGETVAGWIVYKNVGYSKGLHRFIEKQVTKWVRENAIDPSLVSDSRYRVVFDRELHNKLVACRVELRVRLQVWVGCEVAATADAALIRSLQRIRFVSNPLQLPTWAQRNMGLSQAV